MTPPKSTPVQFSTEVIVFLSRLLHTVTLNVNGEDFEETAALSVKAKRELAAALQAVAPDDSQALSRNA